VSQEENRPLENSQEIRDNPEETKVTVEEKKEENPPILPTYSKEKKENDTQKLDLQSPIQAMIEKSESGSAGPEAMTEEKVMEKKPKRTRSSKKKTKSESGSAGLDSRSTFPEKSNQKKKKTDRSEVGAKELDNLPQPLEEQKISNKGVAHFKDNVVKIAGGFKLHSGDEIKIGDREFELRHLEPSKKPLYWGILALGILVLFFIFQFGFTGYKDSGKIVGVVIEKGTGAFLPNTQIELKDLGKKVRSNDLGFFILDVLPAGTYELQAQLNGYNSTSENAVVLKKQITTTVVELSSQKEVVSSSRTSSAQKRTESQVETVTSKPSASSMVQRGSVKIESNVPGVRFYLDGKYLGAGNKVYSGITGGTHRVRLSKDDYQDWTGKVTVKGNKTSNLKVSLNKVEAAKSTITSPKEVSFFASAQREYDLGNYAGAAENYTKGLYLDSNNPEAYLGRGDSYLKLGDKTKALADFSKGAELFEMKGNFNKAALCYTQLLNLTPGDQNALYSRGLDYIKIGEYEKAVSDLKKVTAQNPKFFNGFMELGNAEYYSKDYKAAAETYSKTRKLNPNTKQVYVKLALTYTALKDKSGAKKNYEKFKELTTLIDRERMKDNPEWIKVLKYLGEKTEREF